VESIASARKPSLYVLSQSNEVYGFAICGRYNHADNSTCRSTPSTAPIRLPNGHAIDAAVCESLATHGDVRIQINDPGIADLAST